LAFAIVAGYWFLKAVAGSGGTASAETVLVRAAAAAVAGFVLGWAACTHGGVLIGEVVEDEGNEGEDVDEADGGTDEGGALSATGDAIESGDRRDAGA